MSGRHHRLDWRRWAYTRRRVFTRDRWRCRRCGRGGRLECDHVIPLESVPDQDVYALAGLQTLCRGCHIAKTREEARQRRRVPEKPEVEAWRRYVAESLT